MLVVSSHGSITDAVSSAETNGNNDNPGNLHSRTALMDCLKTCRQQNNLRRGSMVHTNILQRRGRRSFDKDLSICTALINLYAKCGALAEAVDVFDELPVRNVVCWNALIAGYVQNGHGHEALNCFLKMEAEGIVPSAFTFASALKACGLTGSLKKGEEIHDEIRKQGLLLDDSVLGTALIDMYSKCGAVSKAQKAFSGFSKHDVISWTALISGYIQDGLFHEALRCFEKMQGEGTSPNAATYVCIFKACGSLGLVEAAEEMHAKVIEQGLLGNNTVLGNALIDMYAKCGLLCKAEVVFDQLPVQDVISWSSVITGYVYYGMPFKALDCFEKMRNKRITPNVITLINILRACGNACLLRRGEDIHSEIGKQGFLEECTVSLTNAIIEMYAKCGDLEAAENLLNQLVVKDVVFWNAIISGHAQYGNTRGALISFSKMIKDDILPDAVTFISLLSACCHAGQVDEGEVCFKVMSDIYCLSPSISHCTCMVDLLSRTCQYHKALILIQNIAISDRIPLWSALLEGCKHTVNVKLATHAFENLVHLDKHYAPAYVSISNVHALAGIQERFF